MNWFEYGDKEEVLAVVAIILIFLPILLIVK
jgi:hypothetical protein